MGDFTSKNANLYGSNKKSLLFTCAEGTATVVMGQARANSKIKIVDAWFLPESSQTIGGTVDITNTTGADVIATKTLTATVANTPLRLTIDATYEDVAIGDLMTATMTRSSGTFPKGTLEVTYVDRDVE